VRAGLADALAAAKLTVFAPTDAAFRAAGFADVAAINNTPVATLTAVLQYDDWKQSNRRSYSNCRQPGY